MKIRRLRILGIALALSALAAAVGVVCYSLPNGTAATVNRIEDYVVINDAMLALRAQPWAAPLHLPDYDQENEHLRLIAIDEASLGPQGFGYWPWPRSRWAQLIDKLHRAGAKVVAFDVTFPDPGAIPANDVALARAFAEQRSVEGFAITTPGGHLQPEYPYPALRRSASALGFTTVDNPGGWMVGQPLVNGPFKSLAAATVEQYTGLTISPIDAGKARFGDGTIPLDGNGEFLMLPFITNEKTDIGGGSLASRAGASVLSAPFFQFVSIVDALKFDDATLKAFAGGDIVVVGTTAQAMGDFVVTPNGRYPGVFTNLRLMDQLLTHKYIVRVPPWLDIALIILLPLLIGFIVTQLKPLLGIAVGAAVVIVYSAFSILLYSATLHWINLIHVDAAVLFAALFVAMYRVVTEGADKRVIREMFGKHVSPAIVDEMMKSEDPLKALDLSGKRVKVTVFYSDIRGFTSMSEKMTPEEIYGQLNEYFEEMCQIIFKYGGYVDKFIGDCVMAVFSAPNPTPDDAYKAVRSAWEQQQKILEMATAWTAQGRQAFTVGMGCNTGDVVMGNLGSSDRLNYTVIGDNVNTAARLYNVAKGGQIIISESTYNEVKDRFIVNELTPVFVKGKVLPLRNFEIVALLEPGQPNTSTLLDPDNLPEPEHAAAH